MLDLSEALRLGVALLEVNVKYLLGEAQVFG
jgi:hypothetical protein